MQYGRSGSVGGSIPSWSTVVPLVFQLNLNMCFQNLTWARGFPRPISQKSATILGLSPRAQFSQKIAMILEFSSRAQFSQTYAAFFGFFPNTIFGNFLLLNSPWVHCRSVGLSVAFNTVFSECGARTEFPEPNFPKNLFQAARLDQCSLR